MYFKCVLFLVCLKGFGQTAMFDQAYTIFRNSDINIDQEASLIKGNSTVFEYFAQTPNFEQTMGDDLGYSMSFLFKMDTLNDSFTLEDGSLAGAKTVFTLYGQCLPNHHDISKGIIKGKKLKNGDWKIEINVVSGPELLEYPIHATGIFHNTAESESSNAFTGQNETSDLFDTITEFRYTSGHMGWDGEGVGSSSIIIKNDSVYFEPKGMRMQNKFKLKDTDWRNLTNSVSLNDFSGNTAAAGLTESNNINRGGIYIRTNKSRAYRKIPEGTNSNLTELMHLFQSIECDHFIHCPRDTSFTIVRNSGNSIEFQCLENRPDFDPRNQISKSASFEIDDSKSNFSLKDSALVQAMTFVTVNCICPENGTHAVTKGKITGLRQSEDEWEIKVNIFYTDDTGKQHPFRETGIYRYKW
jgi:hypothetical protein